MWYLELIMSCYLLVVLLSASQLTSFPLHNYIMDQQLQNIVYGYKLESSQILYNTQFVPTNNRVHFSPFINGYTLDTGKYFSVHNKFLNGMYKVRDNTASFYGQAIWRGAWTHPYTAVFRQGKLVRSVIIDRVGRVRMRRE